MKDREIPLKSPLGAKEETFGRENYRWLRPEIYLA